MPAITPKQQKFCNEYLTDLNATQAYKRVYKTSENVASASSARMLANVRIKAYLAIKQNKLAKKTLITQEEIINDLKELKNRCMQKEQVMVFNAKTKRMEPTGEWKFEHTGANKSLELLAKHLGMLTEKIELNAKVDVTVLSQYFTRKDL